MAETAEESLDAKLFGKVLEAVKSDDQALSILSDGLTADEIQQFTTFALSASSECGGIFN